MNDLAAATLSKSQRRWILTLAFLAWLGAGMQMGLGTLVAPIAASSLLPAVPPEVARLARPALGYTIGGPPAVGVSGTKIRNGMVGEQFALQMAAMQFGAAIGGILLGRFADKHGRKRGLAVSIALYTLGCASSAFVPTTQWLLAARFLTGLGIGGTWPAAVALAGEAWPDAAKAKVAGIIGMSANVGILVQALFSQQLVITAETWQTAALIGAAPVVLALFVWILLPESPQWLRERSQPTAKPVTPVVELFQPALIRSTLIGICLAAVALVGAWGSGKWLIPWSRESGVANAQATTQAIWAVGAVISSAFGGWIANQFGRRITYFVVSIATLAVNYSIYAYLTPSHSLFLPMVFLSGLSGTVFFGWLPLYLPELFPTRVRATGIGLTYNTGRIASAVGIYYAADLMNHYHGDFSAVGKITSLVYALGIIVILFAPAGGDAQRKPTEEQRLPAAKPA
jgi:MFS family permease